MCAVLVGNFKRVKRVDQWDQDSNVGDFVNTKVGNKKFPDIENYSLEFGVNEPNNEIQFYDEIVLQESSQV